MSPALQADLATSAAGPDVRRRRKARRWRLGLLFGLLAALAGAGWYVARERAAASRRAAFLHAALGVERYEAGKLPEAIAQFEQATRLDPGNPNAWYLLGKTEREQNPGQGLRALERAVTGAPREPRFLRDYGRALLDAGKSDEAREVLSRAVRLAPTDTGAHVGLGRAYLAGAATPAEVEQGIGELRTALSLQPGDIQARFLLAKAYYQGNRLDEAEREFRMTLSLLAEGARKHPGFLDGRTTWSRTWLSLVKGCHYHLMQIAYRRRRDAEVLRYRQAHAELDRYIKDTYTLFGPVNADPEDRAARRRLARVMVRHGLPPAGADAETSIRRWITRWQTHESPAR